MTLRVTAIAATPDEELLVRWVEALRSAGVELRSARGAQLSGHALARAYAVSAAILGGR